MQHCNHPGDSCEKLFPACDYISGEPFQVARCCACGQVVTVPVPADIGRYYPGGYYGDASGRRFPALMEWLQVQLYEWRARQVLRRLKRKQPRVLDVGCGRGLLLRAFQRNGCDVTGTEFSDDACRFAREVLKLPVRVGLLHELNFPDRSFDIVVMWHVLEHVSDPRPTLAEVSRILRPGGIFLVAVPNFGSPEARLTKAGWFHLDIPRHLSHHTRASLTQALAVAGMPPVWSSSIAPEYDNFSFVQSLLNWLGVRSNLLYNWLRGQNAKVIDGKKHGGSVVATLLLAPVLGVISLPVTLVLGALGQGATLTLSAVKKESVAGR
ncbi:MAG TPA: class I SAM-dependent methyltransferase [Candidatus Binatia bacterium]|nr:class I SAM-dependent methyltransferase [Candidatus Binatia bacterium]